MTKQELLAKLTALQGPCDEEHNHSVADGALLEYINDAEITEAYNAIHKFYA